MPHRVCHPPHYWVRVSYSRCHAPRIWPRPWHQILFRKSSRGRSRLNLECLPLRSCHLGRSVDDLFAAVDASDFYGRAVVSAFHDELGTIEAGDRGGLLVAYLLINILSEFAKVPKGLCKFDSLHRLVRILAGILVGIEQSKSILADCEGRGGLLDSFFPFLLEESSYHDAILPAMKGPVCEIAAGRLGGVFLRVCPLIMEAGRETTCSPQGPVGYFSHSINLGLIS